MERRLNLAYMTTLAGSLDDENVGMKVVDPDSGRDYGYRRGSLEEIARHLQENDTFAQFFNLAAIVVNDTENDYHRLLGAGKGERRVWPNLEIPFRGTQGEITERTTLDALTMCLPSTCWTRIITQASGPRVNQINEMKAERKAEYEREIIDYFLFHEIDLIISDRYTHVIGPSLLNAFPRRILNISAGSTDTSDPYRLPGKTPVRDAYTRARSGYVIIDDKHAVPLPPGERTMVTYLGVEREAVLTGKVALTGATVHVVDEKVNHGPVIMKLIHSFHPTDTTFEALQEMNCRTKRNLLPEALMHYAQHKGVHYSRPDWKDVFSTISTAGP